MALGHAPSINMNGLVFYIDAANPRCYSGSGIDIADIIGGVGGTFWGGTGYSTGNSGSFYFNGSNAIRYEDSTTLRPANLTISAWCRFNSFDSFDTIISKAQNAPAWTAPYLSYMIRVESNGSNVNYALGDGSYRSLSYSYSFAINTYYHFSMTYDGANLRGYLNGVNVATTPLVITISYASHPVLISGSHGSVPFGETISGNIPSVQIYNRALSTAEVLQNYNAAKKRFGL